MTRRKLSDSRENVYTVQCVLFPIFVWPGTVRRRVFCCCCRICVRFLSPSKCPKIYVHQFTWQIKLFSFFFRSMFGKSAAGAVATRAPAALPPVARAPSAAGVSGARVAGKMSAPARRSMAPQQQQPPTLKGAVSREGKF